MGKEVKNMKKKLLFCLLVISITLSCSFNPEQEAVTPYEKELVAEVKTCLDGDRDAKKFLKAYLKSEDDISREALEVVLRAMIEEAKEQN